MYKKLHGPMFNSKKLRRNVQQENGLFIVSHKKSYNAYLGRIFNGKEK